MRRRERSLLSFAFALQSVSCRVFFLDSSVSSKLLLFTEKKAERLRDADWMPNTSNYESPSERDPAGESEAAS